MAGEGRARVQGAALLGVQVFLGERGGSDCPPWPRFPGKPATCRPRAARTPLAVGGTGPPAAARAPVEEPGFFCPYGAKGDWLCGLASAWQTGSWQAAPSAGARGPLPRDPLGRVASPTHTRPPS